VSGCRRSPERYPWPLARVDRTNGINQRQASNDVQRLLALFPLSAQPRLPGGFTALATNLTFDL
jgi:hypothetical protein